MARNGITGACRGLSARAGGPLLLLLHLAAAAGVGWSVCAAFGTLVDD